MKSAASVENAPAGSQPAPTPAPARTLAVGWLAMAPLFVAYELALSHFAGSRRNTGELLLGAALEPLGERAMLVRWSALGAVALVALAVALRRGASVLPSVARIVLEGLGLAIVLGPLLVFLSNALDEPLDVSWTPGELAPGAADAAMLFGGAAWEELLFRVGIYSFVYWLALRFWRALDGSEGFGRAVAELAGLSLSTLAFAGAHFERFTRWLGPGGRPWDSSAFTWYLLAGAALGLIFRLRGPGVAAWTHGVFNVALWLGADPDVLR